MRKHFAHNIKASFTLCTLVVLFLNISIVEGATEAVDPRKGIYVDDSSLYRANSKNIADSGLFTTVPGCNNIGNKVQKSIGGILNNDPTSFVTLADSIGDLTGDNVTTQDMAANSALKDILSSTKEDQFRSECMDGIGYQLAKKQLASITNKIISGAVVGNNGDSMFKDESSLLESIQNKEISRVAKTFGTSTDTNAYPFGKEYSRGLITSTRAQNNFEESMKSDLSQYGGIQGASKNFNWDKWMNITQNVQNNYLGHTVAVSQHLTDSINQKTQVQRDELNQNSGFLSQKKCVEYYPSTSSGTIAPGGGTYNTGQGACKRWQVLTPGSIIAQQLFAVVTSPIRQLELADGVNETLSGVFNKLVNKLGLQGLFGVSSFATRQGSYTVGGDSISSSFGSSTGFGFGSSFGSSTGDGDAIISVNRGNGWYEGDEPFDLTKDLGNTYLREKPKYLGTWNASTNKTTPTAESGEEATSLAPGIGIKNTYYVVSTGGNTEINIPETCFPVLYADGSTSQCWKRGNILIFDGERWLKAHYFNGRNDGSGFKVIPGENGEAESTLVDLLKSPRLKIIDKKGVIQTQYDYLKAIKASMRELPNIMPALGELDYCIPGPNPSWYESAELAGEALSGYISKIQIDPNTLQIIGPPPAQYKTQYFGSKPWKQLNPKKFETLFQNYFGVDPNQFASTFMNSIMSTTASGNTGFSGNIVGDIVGGLLGTNNSSGPSPSEIAFQQAYAEAQEILEAEKEAAITIIGNQLQSYKGASDAIYGQGGVMTTELLINPDTEEATENPNYLPMAQAGMALTRDIRLYDVNIDEATQDYKDLIDESVANIYKLNLIKTKVDKIVKAAQARRSKELPANTIPDDCLMYEQISYINGGITTGDLNTINGDLSGGGTGGGVTGVGGGVIYTNGTGGVTGAGTGVGGQ